MITLSQRDKRWSQIFIPGTKRTIGQIGCYITDLSMLSDYFGEYMPPNEIIKHLKFTPDGRVYLSSIDFKKFKLTKRGYGNNWIEIVDALLGSPKTAAMIQVNGNHWCVVTNKVLKTLIVADPWIGLRVPNYKKITGYSLFHSK